MQLRSSCSWVSAAPRFRFSAELDERLVAVTPDGSPEQIAQLRELIARLDTKDSSTGDEVVEHTVTVACAGEPTVPPHSKL